MASVGDSQLISEPQRDAQSCRASSFPQPVKLHSSTACDLCVPQPLVQSHQHTITASFSLEKTLESIESNCKTPNQVSSCSVVTHLKPQPMTGKSLSAAAPFPQGCFHCLICFPQGSTYHSSLIPVLPQPAKHWPWGWECSAAQSNRPGRPEKSPTQLSLDRLQKLL